MSEEKPSFKTVSVALEKPIVGHGGTFTHVTVREPTVAEYLELGDPFLVGMSSKQDIGFAVEDKTAMASYARALVVEPDWLLVETQAGWRDMRAIMAAVRGFFRDGTEADGASGT